MANKDIALKYNDLAFDINAGDFSVQESDEQHVADTINAFPGWWKENPADGVGIFSFINSSGREQEIRRSVILNLENDGYTLQNPVISVGIDGVMHINPNATNENPDS